MNYITKVGIHRAPLQDIEKYNRALAFIDGTLFPLWLIDSINHDSLRNCRGVRNLQLFLFYSQSCSEVSLYLRLSPQACYSQRQFLPQLLRKICLGSHSGLASWSSSGANQSQQGINSTLNLTHTEGSTLSSWPCQATTTPSRSGPRGLTSNAATPAIRHKAPARHSFILKKQI